ncbi:cytochrome P450 family protein [Embleya sp. MST-111070]|uniref:cytochrome P450 family protein n=1 Tax=Embleya sp. MST-111070 TaxID=3398231 RepID=UPI003F737724
MDDPRTPGADKPATVDLRPHTDALIHAPHTVYAPLLEQGPVHWAIQPDGTRTWLVLGYPEAKAALAHPALSSNPVHATPQWRAHYLGDPDTTEFPHGRNMLNSDPPEHTRLRKPTTQAFTPRRIETLRPTVEEHTARLLRALPPRDPFDLIDDFAAPLTLVMICDVLGVPELDHGRIREWADRVSFPAVPEDAIRARQDLIPYFDRLIGNKRACPGGGLFDALLRTADGDLLSHDELRATAFLLLLAGHETTISLLSNAVLNLLTHPDQLALLRGNPDLVDQAIDETLRLTPPAPSPFPRFAREDLTLGHTSIPGDGSQVQIVIAGAHRDPRQFPNPDAFDIGRPTDYLLAFGHGIHSCPGRSLAHLEATIAIPALLEHFPNLELAAAPDALDWRTGPLLRALTHLPCTAGASGVRPTAAAARNR